MNFLAHISLSANHTELMIGNFIADHVRKVEWQQFSPKIVQGIELHHKIDFFTDNHHIVERSKQRLRPCHGKYSGVVADILYDHFLSANYQEFYPQTTVQDFAQNFYALLRKRFNELPSGTQYMLPYMEQHNWLVAYGHKEGLQQVFNGMHRRASFKNNMHKAVAHLFENYEDYKVEFYEFYPLLQGFVKHEINRLKA